MGLYSLHTAENCCLLLFQVKYEHIICCRNTELQDAIYNKLIETEKKNREIERDKVGWSANTSLLTPRSNWEPFRRAARRHQPYRSLRISKSCAIIHTWSMKSCRRAKTVSIVSLVVLDLEKGSAWFKKEKLKGVFWSKSLTLGQTFKNQPKCYGGKFFPSICSGCDPSCYFLAFSVDTTLLPVVSV